MDRSQIRIAVCGFGSSAEFFHLPLILADPLMIPVAIFDPVPERREAGMSHGFQHGFPPEDLPEVIRRLGLHAVVVTSPSAMHPAHAEAALRAGAHVLVDKPLALSLAEADSLIDLSSRLRRTLLPFHNRRFDDDHTQTVSLLKAGTIGRVLRIDGTVTDWGPFNRHATRSFHPAWRVERAYGGGCLYDWGPHIFDQLLRFAGGQLPRRLHVIGKSVLWSQECEDLLAAMFEWDGFCARILISSVDLAPSERWRICGDLGTLIVRGDDVNGTIEIHGLDGRRTQHSYHNSPMLGARYYDALLASVAGKPASAHRLLRDARKTQEFLEQARNSLNAAEPAPIRRAPPGLR